MDRSLASYSRAGCAPAAGLLPLSEIFDLRSPTVCLTAAPMHWRFNKSSTRRAQRRPGHVSADSSCYLTDCFSTQIHHDGRNVKERAMGFAVGVGAAQADVCKHPVIKSQERTALTTNRQGRT